MKNRAIWGIALGLCCLAGASQAQQYSAERPTGLSAQQLPAYLQHAGVQQHLNQLLPLTTPFQSEDGTVAPLSKWIGPRPTVIALVYYKCAMMCPQVLHGLATGLRQTSLVPGKDYDVVTFSIDPSDTAADAAKEKSTFLADLGLPAAASATHFLTGSDRAIQSISQATGFDFVRVPGPDGQMNQFAHASVIMFVTPDGRLSKYISGIDYPARDLRLALLDASQKKISNPVDLFMIYCCSYNPAVGRYSVAILRVVSFAGMLTLAAIGAMLWLLMRRSDAVPA